MPVLGRALSALRQVFEKAGEMKRELARGRSTVGELRRELETTSKEAALIRERADKLAARFEQVRSSRSDCYRLRGQSGRSPSRFALRRLQRSNPSNAERRPIGCRSATATALQQWSKKDEGGIFLSYEASNNLSRPKGTRDAFPTLLTPPSLRQVEDTNDGSNNDVHL